MRRFAKPRRFLLRPGAIWSAIRAASMRIVPEPHIGSMKFVLPSQPDLLTMTAARFSLMGAVPAFARYSRRWSDSPLMSMLTLTWLFLSRWT